MFWNIINSSKCCLAHYRQIGDNKVTLCCFNKSLIWVIFNLNSHIRWTDEHAIFIQTFILKFFAINNFLPKHLTWLSSRKADGQPLYLLVILGCKTSALFDLLYFIYKYFSVHQIIKSLILTNCFISNSLCWTSTKTTENISLLKH